MVFSRAGIRQLVRFNCLEAISGRKNCEGGFKIGNSAPPRPNYPVAAPCGGRIFVECTKICENFIRIASTSESKKIDDFTQEINKREAEINKLEKTIVSREVLKKKYEDIDKDRDLLREMGKKMLERLEKEAIYKNYPIRNTREGGKI